MLEMYYSKCTVIFQYHFGEIYYSDLGSVISTYEFCITHQMWVAHTQVQECCQDEHFKLLYVKG